RAPWLVLVETPYAGVIAPAQRFLKRAALAGFLLLATGLGCAWWLSGRLTRPLLELTAAADAISAGDYSMRVPVEREDEVGHLAGTFNVMAERIQVSQHGLQQRFQALVDGVVDYAVFMLDPEGTVVTWNPGAERLKGYRKEEILGRHFSCFYPPEDNAAGKPARELEVAAAEGRVEDEGWRVRKDGSRFWANMVLTGLRDHEGTLIGFAKVTRDLTEIRRAQEVLRASEEYERLIVDAAHDAFVAMDEEGVITSWNRQAERTFGWPRDEAIGRSLAGTIVPERHRDAHRHGLKHFLATGEGPVLNRVIEITAVRRDGQEFPVELSISPLSFGGKHVFTS